MLFALCDLDTNLPPRTGDGNGSIGEITQAPEAFQFDTIDDVLATSRRGIVIVTDDADRGTKALDYGGGQSDAADDQF